MADSIASLIVRIGARDEEIQNALARVGQKAKSVDADLKKLGNTPLASQAQKSLDSLRATMKQVTDAQQRVADKAKFAAQGLEAMGGASRLTDTQLKQVNRTLQEGLSAYQALGKEPPESLRRIAAETSKATTVTEGWKASLKGLANALTAVFTVRAVVNFGRDLLRMGDEIVRVSDRTGLLTDEVQQLSFIAKQSGNSIDELVGAVGQLQNRLASGDKSAVKAVKALGISFEELRAAGPYEQLQLIATAIAKIPDPAGRAQVAMDLFGRTGVAILPTLTSEFEKLGNAAPKMSHNTVLALDQAGDALEKFQLQVKVWAAESYNSLSGVFDRFSILVLKTTAAFFEATANILSVPLKIPGASTLFPGYQKSLDEVRERAQFASQAAKQLGQGFNTASTEARKAVPIFDALSGSTEKVETAMESIRKALIPLTAAQRAQIDAWDRAGISAETMGKALGISSVAVSNHLDIQKKLATGIDVTNVAMANFAALVSSSALQSGLVQINRDTEVLTDTLENFKKQFSKSADLFPEPPMGTLQAWTKEWQKTHGVIKETSQLGWEMRDNFKDAFSKIPKLLTDAFTGGGGLIGAMKAIGVQLADALTAPFIARLSGMASKFAGLLTGGIGVGGAVAAGASSAIPTIAGTAINVGAGVGGAKGAGILAGAGLNPATIAWTAGISAAIVGIYVGIKKLKEQKAHMEVNRLRDALGDFTKLNPAVQELTGSLDAVQAVFDARNPAQYGAAVANLNAILEIGKQRFEELQASVGTVGAKLSGLTLVTPDLQEAIDLAFGSNKPAAFLQSLKDITAEVDKQQGKFDTIKATLEEYGLKLEDATSKEFQQQVTNIDAKDIRADFDVLRKAGVDINQQMGAMSDKLNAFVKTAKKSGVEVPQSMQEILQVAIDAGQLFDRSTQKIGENGEALEANGEKWDDNKHKITDITQLGLTFGTTMETTMRMVGEATDRLVLVLEGLAKFLGITLPKKAEDGAADVQAALDGIEAPDLTVKVDFDVEKLPKIPSGGWVPDVPEIQGAATGAKVKPWGLQHFAKGTDTIPAMLTPGELVLNAAQQKSLGNALSAGSVVVNLTMYVDGVFSEHDLVQTVERRMVPIFQEVWENNVRGARTRSQDALGIVKPV